MRGEDDQAGSGGTGPREEMRTAQGRQDPQGGNED
jgi:hypothetical protein